MTVLRNPISNPHSHYPSLPMFERALVFAHNAHEGQTRKHTGAPYITHPLRVAHAGLMAGFPNAVRSAALLHDVVEDTDFTLAHISMYFGPHVADLVDAVTRRDGQETYKEYIARVGRHSKWAVYIKLYDIFDNLYGPDTPEHVRQSDKHKGMKLKRYIPAVISLCKDLERMGVSMDGADLRIDKEALQ